MPDIVVEKLPWDSEHFGFAVGRLVARRLDLQGARRAIELATEARLRCLYFLADAQDPTTAHAATQHDFRLVDLRIELERRSQPPPAASSADRSIRPWREDDVASLRGLARRSHGDSRFYFDPGFSTEDCDRLYDRWIGAACRGRADEVLVAELDGDPVGYLAGQVMEAGKVGGGSVGDIDLIAVDQNARGRGLGSGLVAAWLDWLASRGIKECRVVTQARNLVALRFYQQQDFLPRSCAAWYHRWFDVRGTCR